MNGKNTAFENVILEGEYVRLEPLALSHKAGLAEAVCDGELWNLFFTLVPKVDAIDAFIEKSLSDFEKGEGLAFATIDKASNKVVGSTRFMKANLAHKRAEIGTTFIAKSFQKTSINTEAKLLMLRHAFEVMDLNRIEILTDYLNHNSKAAILRLGAKQEGVLRNHMVMPNGRIRDTAIFSIIKNEWPGIEENLLYKLSSWR